ncbi:MAG TPA: hypothetical protein VG797_09340 [Phycisphaerales bacterium]|nr:hypothetical protein [Phycisphaerales bacterium]
MPPAAERVCIVHDGGLPALVACLMAEDPEQVVAWRPPLGVAWGEGTITEVHAAAVQQQVELLSLGRLIEAPVLASNEDERRGGQGLEVSTLLLAAARDALAERCTRLIWPVCCGSDLDALYDAAERATLLTRLIQLDLEEAGREMPVGGRMLRVEVPLADLTSLQVAELALDLDAPTHVCWWRLPGVENVAGGMTTRTEWAGALDAAARAMGFPFAPVAA